MQEHLRPRLLPGAGSARRTGASCVAFPSTGHCHGSPCEFWKARPTRGGFHISLTPSNSAPTRRCAAKTPAWLAGHCHRIGQHTLRHRPFALSPAPAPAARNCANRNDLSDPCSAPRRTPPQNRSPVRDGPQCAKSGCLPPARQFPVPMFRFHDLGARIGAFKS